MTEEWRVIENTLNYEISNCGEVRNKTTKKILKSQLLSGYLCITLKTNNKKTLSKIHRLVATQFLICPDETYVVNHKDGNKTNNHVENLEWISQSENVKHAFRLGLNKGKKNKVYQYTLDNVFIREYNSPIDVENETGIPRKRILYACVKARKTGGYIWKYSDEYTARQDIPEGKTMSEYPNYIITNDGKVYNSQRKRFLCLKHFNGYIGIALTSYDNKIKTFYAHRLVALLFIANPTNLPEVNHIDFDKTNNKIENLEWISHSGNIKHNLSRNIQIPI
jgi:hypothetical protein